jgi:hypothetical protein
MDDHKRTALDTLWTSNCERFTSNQRTLLMPAEVRAALAANDIYTQESIESFTYDELKALGSPITPGVAKALKTAFPGEPSRVIAQFAVLPVC